MCVVSFEDVEDDVVVGCGGGVGSLIVSIEKF